MGVLQSIAAVVSGFARHEQKQTLKVDVYIPDHPDRTESPIFSATRRKLIEKNPDACCYICGSKDQLELHHQHVEWCDSNAVNWAEVSKLEPYFPWNAFDPSKPETFIDSEFNAKLVLCKKHHTAPNHGIHCLPEPLWRFQKLKAKDFVFSPDEEN